MMDHTFVECNWCKTKIMLRFQMGYFNVPFDFCCPNCGVHIRGTRHIIDKQHLEIAEATVIDSTPEDMTFYSDFSVELPHRKITKYESLEKLVLDGFSPFMNMTQMFEADTYQNLIDHMGCFLQFRDSTWTQLQPLYDLYFNRKIELMKSSVQKIASYYTVENELDAAMSLHQLCVFGFNNILESNTLPRFSEYANMIVRKTPMNQIFALITAVGGYDYFSSVLKRLVQIYSRWISNFECYIPAIMISLGNISEKFNRGTHGIATTSFENMKSFYADSYELLLSMIDIAVGLNNITVRGDYNAFHSDSNAKDFADFQSKTKSEKLKSLIANEPYSKEIPLNRHVRNAIAHFDYEFDPNTQKAIFNDKFKNKDNSVELYLIDIAILCYENIEILVYLNELLYSLRKILYTAQGMTPHIGYPKQ